MRKLLNIIRRTFISIIGEESWNIRTPIKRFFYVIEVPALLLLSWGTLAYLNHSLESIKYGHILISIIAFWLLGRVITYGTIYTSISKDRAWASVISNIFFDLLFIAILFDIALNIGLIEEIKKYIIYLRKEADITWVGFGIMLSIVLLYLILFKVLTKARHALPKLFPSMKRFWSDNNLGKFLIDFILLSLYVILFFAFIYYMLFIILDFNGFSSNKINFGEFIFYSFNILYSSPISSIEPTNALTKIVTAVESIFSYLILVVFISLTSNNHTQKLLERNRKGQISKRKFKQRHRS